MNNLIIELNTTSVETVTSDVIEKLYNLAITSNVADENNNFPMSLKGTLTAISAFRDSVLYLRDKFPLLTITVLDNAYYIRFADNNVYLTLNNAGYGDGIGITEFEASTIRFGNLFKNNTSITSFNEFSYFTAQQNNSFSFEGCTNLTSIDLSNVRTLYSSCFKNTKLTEINDLGTITEIPGECFYNCTSLFHITLPETCITIRNRSFYGCTPLSFNLNDLYYVLRMDGHRDGGIFLLPNNGCIPINYPDEDKVLYLPNLKVIGGRTFENLTMKEVNLPSLTSVSIQGAFMNCKQLRKVTSLGSFVMDYWDIYYGYHGMFQGCTSLVEVNIPSTCTTLGSAMFRNCSNLTTLNWDFSVITLMYAFAFSGCTSLNKKVAYFPNAVLVGYPALLSERSIIGTYVGESSSSAAKSTGIFLNCAIKNVYLPKVPVLPLDKLGTSGGGIAPAGVFINAQLDLVYLRDIKSIGPCHFYNSNINTLIINSTSVPAFVPLTTETMERVGMPEWVVDRYDSQLPSYKTDVFAGATLIQNIYVPDSAVSDYLNTSYFSSVASIIKPLSLCPRKTLLEVENGEIGLIEAYM